MDRTRVRTSRYYRASQNAPRPNCNRELCNGRVTRECLHPTCPGSLAETLSRITAELDRDNTGRTHSAVGSITSADKLQRLDQVSFKERHRKSEEARQTLADVPDKVVLPLQRLPDEAPQVTIGALWAEHPALSMCNRSAFPRAKTEVWSFS